MAVSFKGAHFPKEKAKGLCRLVHLLTTDLQEKAEHLWSHSTSPSLIWSANP